MKFIKNFLSFIIYSLMILIFAATVYFCLDVFGIIEVPEQYSIASIFYSKIEVIAAGQSFDNVIEPTNTVADTTQHIVIIDDRRTRIENVDYDELVAALQAEELKKQESGQPVVEIDPLNVNPNRFYYSQLDEYGKIIYDELYKNKENLKSGTYTVDYGREFNELLNSEGGTETLNTAFQYAINSLMFDNPDMFYIDITKVYLLTEITTRAFFKTYNVSIGANGGNYIADEFLEDGMLVKAIQDAEESENRVIDLPYENQMEKIKAAHDYLVDNVEYNGEDKSTAYTIYGSMVLGESVCEGYAKAFKYILDDMGVPCIIVCGIGRNSHGETESHAWNYVLVDNEWYAIDVTWDDPIITNNGRITDEIRYGYYMKGSNQFFEDHFEDGNIVGDASFKYPKLSVINYQW